MQLSNCELLPAVISDTKDPLKLGRIKCVIPGYVDASFSNENMPWVRPLGMTRHQSFSKMMPGFKVWVLVNKNNYNEYWYFPFFEFNDVSKSYLDSTYDNEQPEIIVSHNNGKNHAIFTYDESNGYSQKLGQNHIDIHPDGQIELLGNDGVVKIDGSKVYIGNNNDSMPHVAAFGDVIEEKLSNLQTKLYALAAACSSKGVPLTDDFIAAAETLNELDQIKSQENVYIN